ncbi:S-adenosyl-L-methionine-dependent methyltransferase [Coprinopsis sp. MPI-PUGE-AT-0042]|nr:S-adenosyl-L-methionine-dependent methyltransferase [Coprinopsis sp. MPI-PUGE-AT-0042]
MKHFDQAWFNSTSSSPSDLDGVSTAGYNVPPSEFDTATTDSYDEGEYESTVDPIPPERANLMEEHGRRFHTFDRGIYHLPADEEEWDRLDKQHRTFIDAMGEKYPEEMYHILKSDIPNEKRVIDLGCGTGCWIKDVARDFPNCDALGVDLVVKPDKRDMPPNLSYEMDNINEGLSHFKNEFDVVHVRLIASGVRDYQLMIEEIARTLRPGGMIQLQEFDFHADGAFNERDWATVVGRWMMFLNEAIQKARGDVDAATHLETWVRKHPAFERVVYKDVWLPVVAGPGRRQSTCRYFVRLKDDVALPPSGRPALLKSGLSEHQVAILEENSMREFYESDKTQYTRLQCVHAIRTNVHLEPLSPNIRL